MSLVAWYPLNSDNKNYGIGDMELTWTTAPTFVDGKLGKGMQGGSGYWTASQTASILNNTALSICFWVKPLNTSATSMYFGNNAMTPPNNRKFALFAYQNADDFHWSWQSDTGSNADVTNGMLSDVIPIGQWTHVCVTYQNPNGKIYINGSLVHTFTGTASGTYAYQTTVLHNDTNRIVNDYRFYDHCLSPKEVKEISKGLILHYPMNQVDGIYSGRNLFIKNKAEYYSVTSSSWDGYTLSAIISGNGGIKIPSSYFTAGQKYGLSFKFKKTSGTLQSVGGHSAGFSCSSFIVDNVVTGAHFSDGYALSDDTKTHSVSAVLTYNGNSGDGDNNLYIQINRGYGVSVGFDLYDIKLEKDAVTPWTPAPEDEILEWKHKNLLANADSYTVDTPYSLTPQSNDHYVYLTDLSANVTAGKTYTIQCATDGLWGSHQTDGAAPNRNCTIWIYDGTDHWCFGGDRTQSGRKSWTWTAPRTTSMHVRVNVYKSGNSTVKFWNFKLSEEAEDVSWTPQSGSTTLADSDKIMYDTSGYNNNGYIHSPNPIWDSRAKIGQGSYYFNGSNNYIIAPKTVMVKDEITVSVWAYMDNWSNYASGMRLISCTQSGGWNFESDGGYVNFAIGTGTGSNIYKNAKSSITWANLSSGWHLFTGTYDGYNTKIYIDGELRTTNAAYSTKTPIYYNTNIAIFIGAEAGSSATIPEQYYFNGLMQDIKIYATALSDNDVLELYRNRLSLSNNGTIFCDQYIEEDSLFTRFNADGTMVSASLSDSVPLFYDMKTKGMDDGSVWARVFWHNCQGGSVLFANEAEALDTNSTYKYSKLKYLENFRSTLDSKFEFMLCYPTDNSLYNRWKQSDNPINITETSSNGTVKAGGYEAIHIDMNANYWGGLLKSSSSSTFIDGSVSHGNWFYAIGSYNSHGNGIPSNDSTAHDVELWVRINRENNMMQIYENSIVAKQLIEY